MPTEDVKLLNYGKGPFPYVIRLENIRWTLNTELHQPSHLPAWGSTTDQCHQLSPKHKPCSPWRLKRLQGVRSPQARLFSFVLLQSSSRCKINSTKKKDASLRDKSSSFGCSDSEMLIGGKRKEAAVLNLAPSVVCWNTNLPQLFAGAYLPVYLQQSLL